MVLVTQDMTPSSFPNAGSETEEKVYCSQNFYGARNKNSSSLCLEQVIVGYVAVVKDTLGLDRIHEFKVNKYDEPDFHRWMKQNNPIADAGRQKGSITALILNWREVSWQSWNFWKVHVVTRRLLMWMSIK